MNDPRIRELLERAADLAGDEHPRPTVTLFRQRRAARRRAVAVAVASVTVIALIVGLGAALRLDRSTSPPIDRLRTSAPPSPVPVTAVQLMSYRWSTLPDASIPFRSQASSVWTGTQMIVWGGSSDKRVYADGAAYTPSTRRWRTLPAAPLTGRSNPFMVWTGRQVLIWGGFTASGDKLSDGAMFDPTSRLWTTMATAPLPAPRRGLYGDVQYAARDFTWAGDDAVLLALDKGFAATTAVAVAFDPATNTWRTLPPIQFSPAKNYTGVTAALVAGRLVVWVSSAGAFTLDPADTGWTSEPYAPKAAGCIYTVIPAGNSIIFPGSHESAACGGDLAFYPGARGSDLDLKTNQVRPIPYTSLTDADAGTDSVTVWTGAALLNADDARFRNPNTNKIENAAGATNAWNTRAARWVPLSQAPDLDPTATWVWTGTELIGWGTFRPTSHDQLSATGLAFAPAR